MGKKKSDLSDVNGYSGGSTDDLDLPDPYAEERLKKYGAEKNVTITDYG